MTLGAKCKFTEPMQLLALLLGHGALPDERGLAGQARSKSVFYRIASCFGDLFLL